MSNPGMKIIATTSNKIEWKKMERIGFLIYTLMKFNKPYFEKIFTYLFIKTNLIWSMEN
jgi:hypothetical protein